MNKFTKEELIELHCVWFNMLSARDATAFESVLLCKLESMIENYCEHELLNKKLLDYISDKAIEKHKTCLQDQFDNGYFWAMKELQSLILKGEFQDDNQ